MNKAYTIVNEVLHTYDMLKELGAKVCYARNEDGVTTMTIKLRDGTEHVRTGEQSLAEYVEGLPAFDFLNYLISLDE